MSARPRLLDLFCGAGGAAMGYHRAGFDVVGVDIAPQPDYPFTFVRGDALKVLRSFEMGGPIPTFDAVHASPPCKLWTALAATSAQEHEDLLTPTREALQAIGLPYVIENVVGAPLDGTTMLCGTMFGLGVFRHRYFETNFPVPLAMHPPHGERVGDGHYFSVVGTGGQRFSGVRPVDAERLLPLEWIGAQLLAAVEVPA